jgi:DNA-binding winged helix-turn-helix (wHTH) protein
MASQITRFYEFGPFRLDAREGLLLYQGREVKLSPKAFDVLLELIRHRDRTVTRDELIRVIWGDDIFIDPHGIDVRISELRKVLGVDDKKIYIETYTKRGYRFPGYRFVAEVKEISDQAGQDTAQPSGQMTPVFPTAKGADPTHSPYVGPGPFPEDRSDDFFGRSKEVREIVRLLSDPDLRKRVVLLYSPSGAGKSSLINAGLRPALLKRTEDFHLLPTARGGAPASPVLPRQNPYTFAAIASMEQEDDPAQNQEPVTWAQYLSTKRSPKPYTILVIDQLEEIVTSTPANRGKLEQIEFFVEIREALAQDSSLHVLLSFRWEYLAELQELAQELSKFWTPYPLTMLRREDAEEAISRPAKHQGVIFEPDDVLTLLVRRLCDDTGKFVDPLQLQLVCGALWKNLAPNQTKISWLTIQQATHVEDDENGEDDLFQIVKREAQVSRFVESILQDFCKEAVESASAEAQAVGDYRFPTELIDLGCLQFVSEKGTRTQIRQDEEWTGDLPNQVADVLKRQQFLRVEQRRRENFYELAHDTLIQPVLDRADRIDDDALRAIFSAAVHDVAATGHARREGIEEADIDEECCLIFVAEDGSPRKVAHAVLKTGSGRLPLWIIEALVRRGILRKIFHLEQEAYELIHWRMALALHRKGFRAMARFYRARKRLETFLEEWRVSGAAPTVWYQRSDEILRILGDVEEDIGPEKLSEMEARFVLRAGLAAGYHLEDFTTEIGKRHPEVTTEILREATQKNDDPEVLRNAAHALALFPLDGREDILIELALNDPLESVWQTAAGALARFKSSDGWAQLFAMLNDRAGRRSALAVLAWMHDALPAEHMPLFEERYKQLSWLMRARFRARLSNVRLQSNKYRILLAGVVVLLSTMLYTVPPRMVLAGFDLTTTQASHTGSRAIMDGFLNGIFGVIPWSLFIGGGLLVWWHVAEGRRPWRGRLSPLIGAVGGLIGGIINTLLLIQAYAPKTLFDMKWLPAIDSNPLEGLTGTGAVFIMPLCGIFVGLGVGASSRRLLQKWWESDETKQKRASKHSSAERPILDISYKAFLNSWWILLPLLVVAAVSLRAILTQMPHQTVSSGKLFCESLIICCGGLGLVNGLFLGLHYLRKGLHISGYEE